MVCNNIDNFENIYEIDIVHQYFYAHHFLWRHSFADGWCLFKQPWSVTCHWNQYNEKIKKKCTSV